MKNILLVSISILVLFSCSKEKTIPNPSSQEIFEARMENKLYPYQDYIAMLNYPTGKPSIEKYRSAMKVAKADYDNLPELRTGQWKVQGPSNLGGRINCIAVDGQNVLLGFTRSGIWKSNDYGENWYCTTDNLVTQSFSDITYDPNNSDIVYAASGDHNVSGNTYNGNGVFKSTDGGESWTSVGLQEAGIISQIKVSDSNPNTVYAAAMGIPFIKSSDRGVYKSTDGGANWEKVLFVNDSTGVIDLDIHPSDDQILYAASWSRLRSNRKSIIASTDAKIFKTSDGGTNWEVLENGLPVGEDISRIGLDIYENNPDILVAAYVQYTDADDCRVGYQLKNIYKSLDAGTNWDTIPKGSEMEILPCNVLGGFGWFFGQVRMNPQNHEDITILGVDMYRTTDNGLTWDIFAPPWWEYRVHADKHEMVFDGDNVWLGTDGGAYLGNLNSSDIDYPESLQWQDIENIPGNLVYRVGIDPSIPDEYFGGLQDNGTTGGNEDFSEFWPRIFGGDGFTPAFHPTDPSSFFVETQRGNIYMTNEFTFFENITVGRLEGSRNWDMHYIISPDNPDIIYTATDRFYRGTISFDSIIWQDLSGPLLPEDDSLSFTRTTFSHVNQSEVDPNLLYGATATGLAFGSKDFGVTWQQIFTDLPRRYYSSIKSSPNIASNVYLTIQGYLDFDNTPYILKSEDYGATFTSLQGNLPEIAINDVLVLPNQTIENKLFVATEAGVYYTSDGGISWVRLGNDMPLISVKEIKFNPFTNTLVAATFGRSIMTYDLAQIIDTNVDEQTLLEKFILYPTVASTVVNIKADFKGSKKALVLNSAGQMIQQATIGDTDQIDITGLNSGVYFIRIEGFGTNRFVKM